MIDIDDAAKRWNSYIRPKGPNWHSTNPTNPVEDPGFSGWGTVTLPALFGVCGLNSLRFMMEPLKVTMMGDGRGMSRLL